MDPLTIVKWFLNSIAYCILECLVVMETSLYRLNLVLPPTARFQDSINNCWDYPFLTELELWSPPATQMFSTVPMPTVTGGEVLTLGGETGRPIPDGDQRV